MKKTILALLALCLAALAPAARAAEPDAAPATGTAAAPAAESAPPAADKSAEPAVTVISRGAKVTLTDHLVAGKITVFDFYSRYCPPCRILSPKLDILQTKRDDLAVVKVDINRPGVKGIDWESPVAQQFSLDSIPHIKIYDASGKLVSEGDDAMNTVLGWLDKIGENPF